jgi:biopolymer transport protein ExbD/biopolymer transport protein TolR
MNSQNAFVARTTKMRTLLALAFISVLFATIECRAQTLQAGISVNLPLVSNAVAVPDADKEDALIVTVTENGDTYLGVDAITPDSLADKIKRAVAFRAEKKVYIKADARAHYADVEKVLSAARKGGVNAPVLLTTQREPVQPGTLIPPKGFEVLAGPQGYSKSLPTLVQVVSSGEQSPTLMVNHEHISWSDLPNVLGRITKAHAASMVQVSADGELPFSDVARVIDIIRSTGATVALVTPIT